MEAEPERVDDGAEAAERVRCLACGFAYSKPLDGGTRANPDCPRCGYVGWLSAAIPFGPGKPERKPPTRPD